MSRKPKLYVADPKPGTPRSVACPRCEAGRGFVCRKMYGTIDRGQPTPNYHGERVRAARRAVSSE